jgi:hypothetical protein
MRNTADVTGGKPIAVLLQSMSGVSAINPLVAFYDIHGGKREVLFFYFVPDTTRDSHDTRRHETRESLTLFQIMVAGKILFYPQEQEKYFHLLKVALRYS